MKLLPARRYVLVAASLLFAGLALRLTYVLLSAPLDGQVWSDMNSYVQVADAIGKGEWQEFHFFQSVGFSLVILFFKKFSFDWAITLSALHLCASMITLVFLWRTAARAFGPIAGLMALAIGAVHLPWIYFISFALPETLFTMLLSVSAYLALRIVTAEEPRLALSLMWGLCFSLALWLKGTHILWAPLLMAALLLQPRRRSWLTSMALGVPIAAGMAAQGFLSYHTVGTAQLGPSNGGLNFVEGKCPDKLNEGPGGANFMSPLYYQLRLESRKVWSRPFTDQRYYWKQGLLCIKRDPFVLIQSLEAIPYLFVGNVTWPLGQRGDGAKVRLYDLYFSMFLLTGLTGYFVTALKTFRMAEFAVWTLPVLSLFLCAYIIKSEVRYRVPFDVWMIPMASAGWLRLWRGKTGYDPPITSRSDAN